MNYLADQYGSNYSYDSTTDIHTFTSNGQTIDGYQGTTLRGNYTKEEIFDIRVTFDTVDLLSGEYLVVWMMDSPPAAEAEQSAGRATGFGPTISLQLRYDGSNYSLNVVEGALTNSPLQDNDTNPITEVISLGQEYYVRIVAQYSSNNGAQIASDSRIRVSGNLFDAKLNNSQFGWNAAWRYIPVWGCILNPTAASRANTNTLRLRDVKVGLSITLNDPLGTGEDEISEQNFISVIPNPDRIVTS